MRQGKLKDKLNRFAGVAKEILNNGLTELDGSDVLIIYTKERANFIQTSNKVSAQKVINNYLLYRKRDLDAAAIKRVNPEKLNEEIGAITGAFEMFISEPGCFFCMIFFDEHGRTLAYAADGNRNDFIKLLTEMNEQMINNDLPQSIED